MNRAWWECCLEISLLHYAFSGSLSQENICMYYLLKKTCGLLHAMSRRRQQKMLTVWVDHHTREQCEHHKDRALDNKNSCPHLWSSWNIKWKHIEVFLISLLDFTYKDMLGQMGKLKGCLLQTRAGLWHRQCGQMLRAL